MKVYCINCKYHQSDSFNNHNYIFSSSSNNCLHPNNIKITEESTALSVHTKISLKEIIFVLNRNNDCSWYKRKWWKFCIKDQQ